MRSEWEVELRGLPGLAVIGLGGERKLSEAPKLMFQDWQVNPNSIFGDGAARPRPQMDDWFCVWQEPKAERRKPRASSPADPITSPVPLRPEDSSCGQRESRSRLKINSRRS